MKKGNFWGLPVNFLFFSLLTVTTTAATLPVFGELLTDPVHTVSRIDSTTAVVLGALTFMIATIGINIVANFVSPAFDFSNVAPQHISWRTGGMIAAVGSIFITPWNLYNNPEVIHYTLDILGSCIGPLFGILIADYYLVLIPSWRGAANYSWFIGMGLGFVFHAVLNRASSGSRLDS